MKKEYSKSRILALVLTIAALAVGQTVRADQTWSVSYETYSVENNRSRPSPSPARKPRRQKPSSTAPSA